MGCIFTHSGLELHRGTQGFNLSWKNETAILLQRSPLGQGLGHLQGPREGHQPLPLLGDGGCGEVRGARGAHQVAVQAQPYRQSSEKLEVLRMDQLIK